ncbi:hypothetical protein SGUI_0105 [Serinicoccus hydrothermalis]|uniref:Uncharacterized protein n=1 Tax=Serinicoccus hydrothermalis TaxID=1758689 RepID=A0A1B1N7W0_9MICO|nr:hypothetical protein [Serinicoccus hydrothermalis]ANS77501.1 hypothetical protein SGUI_0105 [Serinicoccus hydrothermalis]
MRFWRTRTIGETPRPERSPSDLPAQVRPDLAAREQVLASAQEDAHGSWLVLTTYRLLEVAEGGEVLLERPWHEVDTGAWDPDLWALSVAFVDRLGGRQWVLQRRTGPGMVPQVFRERTSASVVLLRAVDLGPRHSARVTIRKVLPTRELVEQVLWGRGADEADPELAAAVWSARVELRDQVGLPPVPPG